jgi:hypothetical protein
VRPNLSVDRYSFAQIHSDSTNKRRYLPHLFIHFTLLVRNPAWTKEFDEAVRAFGGGVPFICPSAPLEAVFPIPNAMAVKLGNTVHADLLGDALGGTVPDANKTDELRQV